MHSFEWVQRYDLLSHSEQQRILNILGDAEYLKDEEIESLSEEQKNSFVKKAEAGVKIDIDKEKLLLTEELIDRDKENSEFRNNKMIKEVYFDLSAYALICIVGYLIGILKIPLSSLEKVSLGSTGGVLISALVLGHIGNVGPFCFRMDSKVLSIIRKITLAYFFATVGLRFGYQVIDSLAGQGFSLVIASIFIGSVAMTLGFFIGKYVFRINWVMLSGAICGGMTSTPGLGAAIDAVGSDELAAGYGAVYPFALIGMVLFSIILNRMV